LTHSQSFIVIDWISVIFSNDFFSSSSAGVLSSRRCLFTFAYDSSNSSNKATAASSSLVSFALRTLCIIVSNVKVS